MYVCALLFFTCNKSGAKESPSYSVGLSDSKKPSGYHIQWTPTVTLTVVQIYQGCIIYTSQVSPLNTTLGVAWVLWPTEWPGLLGSPLWWDNWGVMERSKTGRCQGTLSCSAPFWYPLSVSQLLGCELFFFVISLPSWRTDAFEILSHKSFLL